MSIRSLETTHALDALKKSQSLLIMGEEGSGKSVIGSAVADQLRGDDWHVAVADYGGSTKRTLTEIADQLGVMIEDENGKPLTADILRAEIKEELKRKNSTLICDNAHRYPASLRFWIEDLMMIVPVLLLATRPPRRDIFLKVPRLALQPLSSIEVRSIMLDEASALGLQVQVTELAALEERCGGNPYLAKRVIRESVLEVKQAEGDRVDYIDGTPFLVAALSMVGVVRLMGLGLGDKSLYIMGGLATIFAIIARTLLMRSDMKANRTRF
ncbi:MAG: ATP-binding protein [Synechococcaceae cyanobacterium RM1_1_27]|nr:ATP-binding protein [Synechococcaceae cyanobacterium RM1_1_27]